MNSDYKKSVAVFGMLIPVLLILGLTIVVFLKASGVHKEHEAKAQQQKIDAMARMQNAALEKKLSTQKEKLASWKAILAKEDRRTFLEHWKDVRKHFKAREFTGERPVWKNTSSGLGEDVDHSASEVVMQFDATYRAMQQAFLEVETKLPQMQLDSLKMSPNKDSGTLHFTTTYTVWTNN